MTREEEMYRTATIRQVLELPSDKGIRLFHDGVFYAPVNEAPNGEDKDEDLTFEAPLTAQMVDEVLKIYPFKGEEKCTESYEIPNFIRGRCQLKSGHEGIHQPELVSPTPK